MGTGEHSAAAHSDAGHPHRWRVLIVCCAGLFLLVSSLTSLNVALPALQSDLGATTSDLQWIIDSYAIVFGGLLLTGGAIGDRIGRRRALIGGFAIVAIGSVTGALATSVGVIISGRAVTGLGAALLLPATLSTLSTLTGVFSDADRPQAIAIWAGVAGAGGAFGPAIGGWLIGVGSWNAVFWLNLAMAVAGIAATASMVPQLERPARRPLDPVGTVLSTTAIGLVLFAVIEGPSHPTSVWVIASVFGGVVAAIAFIEHERRTSSPMLPLSIFRSAQRRSGLVTLLFAAVGFAGVIFIAALLLQIGWGESPLVTGLLLVPIGAAELTVSFATPRLCERFGSGSVIRVGLALMAIGYVAMAVTPTGDRLTFELVGIVAGLGNGLTIPPSVERVVADTEPALAGVVAGANETAIELGASLGVGVLGGVQRIVFGSALPAGTPSSSLDAALESVPFETAVDAYVASGRSALIAAAIAVLMALPFARRSVLRHRNQPALRHESGARREH